MAVNLNQVAITGNLTDDPTLTTLPSGHVICEFQLASHHRSCDEVTGEWQEWADYFTVKAFGFQARTAHNGLAKGSSVAIAGRLSSRLTTENSGYSRPDGLPRREVEIVAQAIQFLARPSRAATRAA
jgi:single stranded DNA-binding protein